jgi:hypothetical protein
MFPRTSCLRISFLLLAATYFTHPVASEVPSTEKLFAESHFDQWKAENAKEQIPWKVHLSPARLSIHQRLEMAVEVLVPGGEVARRRGNGQLIFLVQITDSAGARYRSHGIVDLDDVKPEVTKGDVRFSSGAFILPGEYDVALALFDKATGEHSFANNKFHVSPLLNDPLPNLWRGLRAVEFWAPNSGLDRIYRSDTGGRLHLPLITRRPLHLEVIADLTPTDLFGGDYGAYQSYLHGVLPLMKTFSQIKLSNGSVSLAALNLDQRRVNVDQPNLKEIDWPTLKAAVGPSHGPGVVAVKNLLERKHSPAFLREELVRRMNAVPNSAAPAGEPLPVFVVITAPMDPYSFPNLPPIATTDPGCVVFYIQYDFLGLVEARRLDGGSAHVVKMLKPLRVRSFTVRSPESVRLVLAKVLEEISRM